MLQWPVLYGSLSGSQSDPFCRSSNSGRLCCLFLAHSRPLESCFTSVLSFLARDPVDTWPASSCRKESIRPPLSLFLHSQAISGTHGWLLSSSASPGSMNCPWPTGHIHQPHSSLAPSQKFYTIQDTNPYHPRYSFIGSRWVSHLQKEMYFPQYNGKNAELHGCVSTINSHLWNSSSLTHYHIENAPVKSSEPPPGSCWASGFVCCTVWLISTQSSGSPFFF